MVGLRKQGDRHLAQPVRLGGDGRRRRTNSPISPLAACSCFSQPGVATSSSPQGAHAASRAAKRWLEIIEWPKNVCIWICCALPVRNAQRPTSLPQQPSPMAAPLRFGKPPSASINFMNVGK